MFWIVCKALWAFFMEPIVVGIQTLRQATGGRSSLFARGPDVKVRGPAAIVAEKYFQLARDAQATGDLIAAEGYL